MLLHKTRNVLQIGVIKQYSLYVGTIVIWLSAASNVDCCKNLVILFESGLCQNVNNCECNICKFLQGRLLSRQLTNPWFEVCHAIWPPPVKNVINQIPWLSWDLQRLCSLVLSKLTMYVSVSDWTTKICWYCQLQLLLDYWGIKFKYYYTVIVEFELFKLYCIVFRISSGIWLFWFSCQLQFPVRILMVTSIGRAVIWRYVIVYVYDLVWYDY